MEFNRIARIRKLNDEFRHGFHGGRVLLTSGVCELSEDERVAVVEQVRNFSAFDNGNDPHRKHDFGAVRDAEVTYFWKIDYYDSECSGGSEDPSNPALTTRVLTIMRADEY
jgi:hypothetical protein